MQLRVIRFLIREHVEQDDGPPTSQERATHHVVMDDGDVPKVIGAMMESCEVVSLEVKSLDTTSKLNTEAMWKLAVNDGGLYEGETVN